MKVPMRYQRIQLRNQHRPEAAQAIDWLLASVRHQRLPKPQMVVLSATLRVHVRAWLVEQKGWLGEKFVRIDGIKEKFQSGEFKSSHGQVVHSGVVVEVDGSLRNIEYELGKHSTLEPEDEERGILTQDPEAVLGMFDRVDRPTRDLGSTTDSNHTASRSIDGLKLPPSVLEAIATSVALDVDNRALLVVPNGMPVKPVVESLRNLGVETRLMDLREEIVHVSSRPESQHEAEVPSRRPTRPRTRLTQPQSSSVDNGNTKVFVPNPTLLVATTATVRGVDIPTLSHVYIIGGLKSDEWYRHIAGRTGRFGMPGTVISFVGAEGAEHLVGGLTGERQLRRIYDQIGATSEPFPHIN